MIAARRLTAFSLLLFITLTCAGAALPATTPAVSGASAQAFDVKAAVDAYVAKMPASQRERSSSYFEGGYWLILDARRISQDVPWTIRRIHLLRSSQRPHPHHRRHGLER